MTEEEFQRLSERLTKALIEGDFALYQTVMRLPLRVDPREGAAYVLFDTDALREDFDLYHKAIRTQHVTDFYRRILRIDEIEGTEKIAKVTCEMNVLRNAERVVEPFESTFTIEVFNGEWRITEIVSSLGHIDWTLGRADIAPDGGFVPLKPKQASEGTD